MIAIRAKTTHDTYLPGHDTIHTRPLMLLLAGVKPGSICHECVTAVYWRLLDKTWIFSGLR